MPKGMIVTLSGLVVVLVTTLTLYGLGYKGLAGAVGNIGPFAVFVPIIFWIVVFDSKKRWPKVGVWGRYVNLMTFRR